MRKIYLILWMLLIPLATIFFPNSAYAQSDAEYNAAMATIVDGTGYFITTEYEDVKYYLTSDGNLTDEQEYAAVFVFKKTDGGGFKTYGYFLDGGVGNYFSNPVSGDNLNDVKLNTHTIEGCRTTWDAQVFFLNSDGKYAIRATNAAYASSSWGLVGSSFWTVKEGSSLPLAGYSYDVNYVWELQEAPNRDKILAVLQGIINIYEAQLYDETGGKESMNVGTGYGQHPDVETWENFKELLVRVDDAWAFLYDDEDYINDPDCPSFDEALDWKNQADSMYNKILSTEIQYMMPQDGYYRIIANLLYTDNNKTKFVDKAIAASYSKDHQNKGVYETLDRSKANFLWKLTKSESGDSIMIQNAGMGTYLSFSSPKENRLVMTDDVADASYVMFDYAGLDFVENSEDLGNGKEDQDIFYIRLAGQDKGGSNYVHQLGHGAVENAGTYKGHAGKDSGTEQELCFWAPTFTKTNTDKGTSEWYLEYVPDEEAEELIEAFAIVRDHDILVAKNQELRDKVLESLTVAKDVIKTKMITSASQMASPFSQNDFGNKDGGDLSAGVLIDEDKSTYWHSAWSNPPQEPHYIQISDVQGMVGDCEFYLCERSGASNDRPTDFTIYGTDDASLLEMKLGESWQENWSEIATLKVPNFAAGAENYIPFNVEKAYPYIRVVCTHTDCGSSNISYRYFWHAAELQIYTVRDNPNSQFAALGEVAEELERIYNENVDVADEDITLELYQALLDAFDAFNTSMVDPTELRNALSTYATLTKGVVEGSGPGLWNDASIASGFDNLYNEVKEYDEAGKYSAEQNHKYAVMLKAMSKSVMEQANGVKTDKWYHIMFPTEEMYTNYGFDPSSPGGDSKVVDDPNQWGYYVIPGVRTDETEINDEQKEVATGKYFLEFATSETNRVGMSMYFANPEAIEDPDMSMFRFIEQKASDKVDYTSLFSDVKENVLMALDMSTTYTKGEALITDGAQLSSNASDSSEGLHIEYLVDGNPNTYWHSDYHSNVLEPGYIQVALNEPVSGLIQIDVTRRQNASNGHIVRMFVQGSNDAESWTNVGYIETPFTSQNESVTSAPINLNGTYSYLRFTTTYRYGTDSGGNTEFDPFAEITSKDEYNKKWTYFHAAEFQIYPVTANKELSERGAALQQAYWDANRVVLKDVTEDQVTSVYQAYRDYQSEFNTTEGKVVLPNGTDKPAATYVIQNKATGLFLNCKGANNANNSLELIPTFFDYKALGFQRSLIHGTRIDGGNCSYLHSQNFDHRFVTWNATTPNSNSGLVIVEADEEFSVPESFSFYRDVKPGRIADWCNSVSITPEDAPEDAHAYSAVGFYTEENGDSIMTFLAVKEIETIEAGQPALYIYADTTEYEPEDDFVEPIKFTMPSDQELVLEGAMENGLFGTISQYSLQKDEIYFNANKVARCAEDNGVTVTQCSAVLRLSECPQIDPYEVDFDFSIFLDSAGSDVLDGVKSLPAAIQNLSKAGAVYSMDGKLLRTNATLNSLKSLGKGMYILNGVKVAVK